MEANTDSEDKKPDLFTVWVIIMVCYALYRFVKFLFSIHYGQNNVMDQDHF